MMHAQSFFPFRAVRWIGFRALSVTRSFGERIRGYFRRRRYSEIKPFPILGNNCVAGRLCHDLGWQFLSPTVNLWMSVHDFISLVETYCVTGSFPVLIDETASSATPYPFGRAGTSGIHFLHYKSFSDAASAWNRRLARLKASKQSPVLVVSDNSDCSLEDIARFLALPFRKRMVVYDPSKMRLLGNCGVFYPLSPVHGTNVSRTIGMTGRWLYQELFPFSWLLGTEQTSQTERHLETET